jgi:hypothetical protein
VPASAPFDYDWAVVRLVPDVCGGASENVGVVLHARRARFLALRLRADPAALAARHPALDGALLARYFDGLARVAAGGPAAGPIGLLPPSERFHWLTAPRSTVLQPSPVHTGRAADLPAAVAALFDALVAPPAAAPPP